jgi:hypothetical protein
LILYLELGYFLSTLNSTIVNTGHNIHGMRAIDKAVTRLLGNAIIIAPKMINTGEGDYSQYS